ncbi:hypothetical protein CONPUDRAFT_162020 [Coniophora puteana RWD-64-598 SS2]|uniref:Uncharacterized protein n=1 Tax=Coniophora puteana (strain RWD-64-598) TaxID=741705 RepID=A0A5M3MZS1_CONPW|nr:uncharacterized protein CONPUDRAFT_162020 [Coniophora puteana RWD-64-598 SS2]EIW84642.1 hypothetical protein CONPUDRAFT_162020 [Coniophora puteana RWD-64-598 SS2]
MFRILLLTISRRCQIRVILRLRRPACSHRWREWKWQVYAPAPPVRLRAPVSCTIEIGGCYRYIEEYDAKDLRRTMEHLSQVHRLFPLSAAENIGVGADQRCRPRSWGPMESLRSSRRDMRRRWRPQRRRR